MKPFRKTGIIASALLWCALFNSPFANAALVDDAPVNIATLAGGYHVAALAQPSALLLEDFVSSSAGTVTLTNKTFAWGDLLSVLATNVFINGAPTLALSGPGSLVFDVGAQQIFSTSLRMVAAGPRGYAMGGYDLSFVPKVSQVPVPAGLWLLASGIGVLVGARKKKSPLATANLTA